MSQKQPTYCILCGRLLPNGAPVLRVNLRFLARSRRSLAWCLEPCAETDPLHLALADALALTGPESDAAALAAYHAIVDALEPRHGGRAGNILKGFRK